MPTSTMMSQTAPLRMTDEVFEQLRQLIYHASHIFCAESHRSFFEWKVRGRMAVLNIPSFAEYDCFIRHATEGATELGHLLDLVATHETAFFRIRGHFEGLITHVFPTLAFATRTRPRPIRIWSAGCSTGQEPYSIAIALLEARQNPTLPRENELDVNIFATDLSPTVLQVARQGVYSARQVQPIPPQFLTTYFMRVQHEYAVTPGVRQLVQFATSNLINERPAPADSLDVIFCRNVLIYFDRRAQLRVLTMLMQFLSPGGYLFLGDTESLHVFPTISRQVKLIEIADAIFYQKRGVE